LFIKYTQQFPPSVDDGQESGPRQEEESTKKMMFIKRFLCLINGFFEDEYLQFVIRREAFKANGAGSKKKNDFRVGTRQKSIKLKGKKDQSGDADEAIQGECISRR
jgi:hypothetical protein